MDEKILNNLFAEKLIGESEFERIRLSEKADVSVHWELRSLLYLGIVLLTTSIGILVYKNIDTIGHDVLVGIISVLCISCFWYCFKKAKAYTNNKVTSSNSWFDYVLLLGCLLFLTLIAYVQFQYNFFGNKWGLATFIPTVVLFFAAYYFDHLGVLSLAIVTLGTWVGISVTPLRFLKDNDFDSTRLIYSAILLGAFLIAVSYASVNRKIKAHFNFTYKNFGVHVLLAGLLAAMFTFQKIYLPWFLLLLVISYFIFDRAKKENSFYFLVVTILYAYTGISYVVIEVLTGPYGDFIYSLLLYFILSGIALIWVFIHYNKILKRDASL